MPISELWRKRLLPVMLEATDVSDTDLLNRFRDTSDKAAFELLVYRHGTMVWGTCRRILGNHHNAEDAFQATFLALALRSGRIGLSVPGWLHRVAVRAGLDVLRRMRQSALLEPSSEPIDPQPGPLERATTAELSQQIDVAVNRLPERLRQAFVLCDFHGHTLKEAAAALACPVGTVESRLARARQRLRGLLAEFRPATGGALGMVAVPRVLRAATVLTACGGAARPALATLAARAAIGSTWWPALSGLASAIAAALVVAAVALGQAESPKQTPKSTGIGAMQDHPAPPKANSQEDGGPLPRGALVRLGSTRFRHPGIASSEVAFSPDGRQLAAGDDSGVLVFDTQTGKRLHHFPSPPGHRPRVVRFIAEGKQLAIGSGNWSRAAEVTLFDLNIGKKVGASEFTGNSQILIIDITDDGKRALVENRFAKVYLWDMATAQQIWEFDHPEASFTLPFTADGKAFVLARSKTAELYDALTGKPVAVFPAPGPKFRSLYNAAGMSAWAGFTKAGKVLALDDVGYMTLWRVGEWTLLPQSADPASQVYRVHFSQDGKEVIGYTQGGWVRWPLAGGPATQISDASHIFHEGMAQVSADGRVGVDVLHEPAPGRGKGTYAVRITDFATAKTRRIEVDQPVWDPFALSSDGRFVSAVLNVGTDFVVWDTATGKESLRQKRTSKGRFLNGAQLAKDGKSIARSVTGVWQETRAPSPLGALYQAIYVTDHGAAREFKLEPMPRSVYSAGVQFSDDGTKVIVEGHFDQQWEKDTVVALDVGSGRRLATWSRPGGRVAAIRLAPDGRSMTLGDATGKLAIVEIASGQERASFRHGGVILSAAFDGDGSKVVASSPEAPIYVWDLLANAPRWVAGKADALWSDLASGDATIAFEAMRTLRANPVEGVALLKDRVKIPIVPPEAKVTEWLKQLDSPIFAQREQATKELTKVADLIQARLEGARKHAQLETIRRLDLILASINDPTPAHIQLVRACEVMEGIGGAQAWQVLKGWAEGLAGSRLASEAGNSAARLARRKSLDRE
jgi:RNA polymerase sigma factor (sigma-70 family)